jgi:hypothetical protein
MKFRTKRPGIIKNSRTTLYKGSTAIYERSMTFRPCIAAGLAFSLFNSSSPNYYYTIFITWKSKIKSFNDSIMQNDLSNEVE